MPSAVEPIRVETRHSPRRIALVHDYLVQDGGSERVLLALHELFPRAPIYTLFHNPERTHIGFKHADIRPSHLNKLPFARKRYQWYLPLMASAVESFDLSGYDLVISSSSTFAKGALAAPEALHVCYCHTPTRFLWQERNDYVNELPQPKFIKRMLPPILHQLRQWDAIAARRPDVLLTNSKTSQQRIRRYYQRDSEIIAPPVDVERVPFSTKPGTFWLTGGRLVAYKRFDLAVRAFAKLNVPLKIFGEGPEMEKLKRMAGPKTEFLGHITDEAKVHLFRDAIAFLHPQIEDFGITAVEAMAAGRPIIAFGQGGAAETVLDGVTGTFFEIQCWEDVGNAVLRFDPARFDPRKIRQHAETFGKPRFLHQLKERLDRAWAEHIRV